MPSVVYGLSAARRIDMKNAVTPIVLCSDDYALNPGVDDGILALLALGHLSAVSCFSTAPNWQSMSAPALRTYREQADIGLHFNLTEGFGTNAPSLGTVMLRSLVRSMNRKKVEKELERQFDAFEDGFGQAPDFVDGHQHVHQFQGVRQILLAVIKRRYMNHPIWVRNTVPADPAWRGKPRLLKYLGGQSLAKDLKFAEVASNNGFAGVYGFDREDYAACFRDWLNSAQVGMLIMSHPSTEPFPDDEISQQRIVEYQFFQSGQFEQMLAETQTKLVRLSSLIA